MPTDKLKHPSKYPDLFRASLFFRGSGFGFEIARGTEDECLLTARKYRAFIKSCLQYPMSREYEHLQQIDARTKVKELVSGKFLCLVVVKRKLHLESRIENAIAGK